MSGLAGYEDAPTPLTDSERRNMKKMFSDWWEVPGEWKTSLKQELERDPPVLGKQTLGGQSAKVAEHSISNIHVSDGANIELGKLASSGQIGGFSQVEVISAGLRLGGDTVVRRTASGQLDTPALLRLGGDTSVERSAAGQIDVGKLRVMTSAGSELLASAWLNINGTVRQVKVGPNNSGPGGVGRVLYIDNSS